MITVHTIRELREQVLAARRQGQRIGFVPTMGNLHDGHISLVDRAHAEDCFVVASIFVNPMQFNDPKDLERYPRTLEQDQQRLAAASCELLFAPDVKEMYPNGQASMSRVTVPGVSEGLCGGARPGHFDGVATVVTKLFNMVQPDQAFFGEKDYQQIAVIRKMVADLDMPIKITAVPTARAADGLALSSRNGYLTAEERAIAPALHQGLQQLGQLLKQGVTVAEAIAEARQAIDNSGFRCDYLEVRCADNLEVVSAPQPGDKLVILGAAFLGNARLIDNIQVALNPHID
ncbi:pantoate--beta-alanine ligase [Parathalassolituus penaei]|uniref:Pantothenate synthetase n=1 Tax=Parathalassolituus penaei TaxID=2997323 RepID=A0A9X3IR14_9GAMM|nr:pantoate--beta-alanine ligase [Parathalassolituus penaei]MCY0964371.1 pantoate--beta-alanine ligase [Parathalassolituus penaei]